MTRLEYNRHGRLKSESCLGIYLVCLPELSACCVEVILGHSLLCFVVQGNCLLTLQHIKPRLCVAADNITYTENSIGTKLQRNDR